jgi:Na+-transporting methylmalonyl-CoA/oxaloacetate decarboxylase gamma subunit
LAYAGITLLCGGLMFMVTKSALEALFFIFVIAFLLILLITLISDLDNPFGFAEAYSAEDVSLDVLLLALGRISAVVAAARRSG